MSVVADPPAPPLSAPAADRPMGPRSPWAAAALTFFAPGVGHVYAGHARRGMMAAAAFVAVVMGGMAASMAAGVPALRIACLLLIPLAVLGMMADAWLTARRADPGREARPYQRLWVYAALLAVSAFIVTPALRGAFLARWHAFHITTPPMSPTLRPGDFLMATRTVRIQRGTAATYRMENGGEAVSRIAAVAGDTVGMRDGVLTVNGVRERRDAVRGYVSQAAGDDFAWQRELLAGDTSGYAPTLLTWGPLVVPGGHVMLIGDNRPGSLDSRHLGFIPEYEITGRPVWIYFSREPLTGGIHWDRIGQSIR